jgi:hypothetical protein
MQNAEIVYPLNPKFAHVTMVGVMGGCNCIFLYIKKGKADVP